MICRLCLVKVNVENKVSLFNSVENNGELMVVKMIAKYFHLEITQYDAISTTICQDCCNHLDEFHTFCIYVEKQQCTLRNEFLEVKCDVEFSFNGKEPVNSHSNEESLLDIKDVLADSAEQAQELMDVVQLKCEPEEPFFIDIDHSPTNDNNVLESSDDDVPLTNLKKYVLLPTAMVEDQSKRKSSLKYNYSKDVKGANKKRQLCERKTSTAIKSQSSLNKNKKSTLKNKKSPAIKSCKKEPTTLASEKQKEAADMDAFIAKYMQLKCELCDMSFDKFGDMRPHFKDYHGIRSYVVCCGSRCGTRKDLFEHIHWHLNPEYFKCDECGKLLKSREILASHKIKIHQKSEDLIYTCEICNKRYARQSLLNQHLTHHHAEKKYTCEHCSKSFISKLVLEKHIRSIHDNIFPYMCDVCGKKYKFKPSFDTHVLEHQGIIQPPVQCTICGEWKMNKNGMRMHMFKHNNVDVKCKHCGRVCPSLTAMRGHVKYMHRATLKYQCEYCEKSFKTETNMKEHVATHTGENLYTCPHCVREFRSRANMYVHVKRQHPQQWLAAQLAKPNGPQTIDTS